VLNADHTTTVATAYLREPITVRSEHSTGYAAR
jgi:hypothetical protein